MALVEMEYMIDFNAIFKEAQLLTKEIGFSELGLLTDSQREQNLSCKSRSNPLIQVENISLFPRLDNIFLISLKKQINIQSSNSDTPSQINKSRKTKAF